MNRFTQSLCGQKGTTFLEVMIALAITGIVTAGVLRLYVTQHDNYLVQEDIADIQQNARASIDEISRNVRMAGYDLPDGLPAIVAYNTNPDTIVLTYQSAGCDTYLASAMPQPSAELKCATDVSCFSDGQWIYIFEPDSGGGEWFEITHVQTAAKHLQHNTMPLSKKYGADAIVVSLGEVKFFVDTTTDCDHPKLMIQLKGQSPQVFAENITDLQFQYRMKGGALVDQPVLIDNIREVLITVTARSNYPDAERQNPYRYRTFATSVNLRNIG